MGVETFESICFYSPFDLRTFKFKMRKKKLNVSNNIYSQIEIGLFARYFRDRSQRIYWVVKTLTTVRRYTLNIVQEAFLSAKVLKDIGQKPR